MQPKTLPIIIAAVIIVCGAAFTYNQVTQARAVQPPDPASVQKQVDAFNKQAIYGNPEMNREILRTSRHTLELQLETLGNIRKAIEVAGRTPELQSQEEGILLQIRSQKHEISELERKITLSQPQAP